MISTDDRTIRDSFYTIYDLTAEKVLGFITARCHRVEDIQDVFQETYTELFVLLTKRGAGYVRQPEALVMKLARQKLARHYSLADRLKRLMPPRHTDQDGEDWERQLAEPISVEDTVADRDMLARIGAVLEQKPQEIRRIFHLFYARQHTIPQIAEELGMSQSNVKHKLYRTLAELRELYGKDHHAQEDEPCGKKN